MSIKQLAGQTLWYGVSNIGAKMLNFLLTPIITYLLPPEDRLVDFGQYGILYAWIAVANIVFTYGFETGYFRFSNKEGVDSTRLFHTTFGSLLFSTFLLCALIIGFQTPIAGFLGMPTHPEYILLAVLLIGADTIAAIPFAQLRQEGRPKRYAFVKLAGIAANIALTVLFIGILPHYILSPHSALALLIKENKVGMLLLANLLQNLLVLALLFPQWRSFNFKIDKVLWRKVWIYSSPMIVVGLAGMVNEVLDRQMLLSYLPLPLTERQATVGIYSANYKISIFITMFIQAFRMAAEPFFFSNATKEDARKTYAVVLRYFSITMCLAFLFTTLFLGLWQYMVPSQFRIGLGIVPILLLANIFLGLYYNLSIWYKITDRMGMGVLITLIGAAITLLCNYIFIPIYGIYAAATVTMACYGSMVVLAYVLGQKYYPVPYPIARISGYLLLTGFIFFVHKYIVAWLPLSSTAGLLAARVGVGAVLFIAFLLIVLRQERSGLQALSRLPLVGGVLGWWMR